MVWIYYNLASAGTQEVTRNIQSVTDAVGHTEQASQHVNTAAGNLIEQSDRLRKSVSTFLERIRSAA